MIDGHMRNVSIRQEIYFAASADAVMIDGHLLASRKRRRRDSAASADAVMIDGHVDDVVCLAAERHSRVGRRGHDRWTLLLFFLS